MTLSNERTSVLSAPGAKALLGSSILARLPLAMFGIALLVHAQRLTGSFAVAGMVSGAYAISGAVSAPLLGRLVDRCGQTRVLVAGATATALMLVTIGLLPSSAPPLLGLGALWSTGAALALSGVVMLASTLAFGAQPASRRWRPDGDASRPRGGSLRSPAMRTLVLILVGTGAVFGATEIGVTAAAKSLGSTAAAGPLLGLWGVGSLLGGIAATRLGGGARRASGLTVLLGALAVGHGALLLTTGSVLALGAVIVLAGATIAPTVASIYAMVDRAAPAGTRTEAFSWLLTASSTGAAAGAAVAGALAQSAGAPAAFAFALAAGGYAVIVAICGSRSLEHVARAPVGAVLAVAA